MCFFSTVGYAQQVTVPIIPYPNHVEVKKGAVDFSNGYQLSGNSSQLEIFTKTMDDAGIAAGNSKKGIRVRLVMEGKDLKHEGYKLTIGKGAVEIKAANEQGVFYGMQSLKQLLLKDKVVPCMYIEDAPAFKWRSFMLDEARYFHGKETVKKLLDDMALLKMNRFHWHLTNDGGWRIEIKAYPLLTEIGSKRDSTQINDQGKKWKSELYDGVPHGGFYTQQEIKEIIAYAAERHIAIIPEISMPGHTSAAIAAYPFIGVTKQAIKVPVKFGVEKTVMDVTDQRAIDFFRQVLKEVAQLFPSEFIHIGGDEVKFDQWKESPAVQEYMSKNGVKNLYDLQVHFTNGISQYVADSLNKRIIGWNEILGKNVHEWSQDDNANATLAKNAIIQFWKGAAKDLLYGIEKGYEVINSDHSNTYLNYTYKEIDLKKSYNFYPIPEGLSKDQQKLVIGLGTQMWTEWAPTIKEVDYHVYPRIAAYAETGWTKLATKDFNRFDKSLQNLINYWKSKKYNLSN